MGPRGNGLKSKLHIYRFALKPHKVTDEKAELMYYQACLFAIELERVALEYLGGVVEQADATGDELTAKAARTLIEEHRSIEQTLQERVGCSDERPGVGAGKMFDPSTCVLSEQFRLSREYIEMITAGALSVELDKIGELQGRGEIDEDIAQQLRQNVYVLQMNAEAE